MWAKEGIVVGRWVERGTRDAPNGEIESYRHISGNSIKNVTHSIFKWSRTLCSTPQREGTRERERANINWNNWQNNVRSSSWHSFRFQPPRPPPPSVPPSINHRSNNRSQQPKNSIVLDHSCSIITRRLLLVLPRVPSGEGWGMMIMIRGR